MALSYPEIDPVALAIGPLEIRWYALAYIAGILLGFELIKRLNKRPAEGLPAPLLTKKALDDLMLYAVLGVLLGGRLGYVLFYKPGYYINNLLEIPQIWMGGMAFHGGFLGVLVAMALLARRHQIPYMALMDIIAVATPIGLFFGRLANFINGELYGRISDASWAMVFPSGGPMPRHPSQLYQAGLEGLLLFLLLLFLAYKTQFRRFPGVLSGIFLAGYGAARFIAEFFREPDAHLGFIFPGISMGQLLSLPMILLGVGIIIWARKQKTT